ncbi:hypothetical protein V2J09_009113 [Rumex salicifolius]
MDIEQKQVELIDHFVNQAANRRGSLLAPLIVEATCHSSLFAFSEILAVPNVVEDCLNRSFKKRGYKLHVVLLFLQGNCYGLVIGWKKFGSLARYKLHGTDQSKFLDLLRLFAHGTWTDYKSNSSCLPSLVPDQVRKLKQLTLLTLSESNKVIGYSRLMQELDFINVRELEDFLINECMYAGIVKGKLDHLHRSFEIKFAAGRDLRPGQLGSIIQTLSATSDSLILSIQEKIKWADSMSELDKKHKKEFQEKVDDTKKSLSGKAAMEFRGNEGDPGVMNLEEDWIRPKRWLDRHM